MITPTIHLNGTSRESLQNGYRAAYEAMTNAVGAMLDCSPNGRDYYPQGPDAFKQAGREHSDRIAKLQGIQREILSLFESLDA